MTTAAPAVQYRPASKYGEDAGFSIPVPWTFDGDLLRKAAVIDDYGRVVRYVGWRRCMFCGNPFFTPDVRRVRLCSEYLCKSRRD